MRRIQMRMFRYGEADFDEDYLRWGFHDEETQITEARSILSLLEATRPLSILDLACGRGVHAVYWAERGHQVTAVDISETFLRHAEQRMRLARVSVCVVASDITSLSFADEFDVVTWIESAFFDDAMVRRVHGFLCDGGVFLFDDRNPENDRTRSRTKDWRTWREEDGVFHLERHETDPVSGEHEDGWITIDPMRELIVEKTAVAAKLLRLSDKMDMLSRAGFRNIELRTMDGRVHTSGAEPYWLWVVARK